MRIASIMIAAALIWMVSPSFASEDDWFKRFQLWNLCEPMFLGVHVSVSEGLGLEKDQVTTAARSRLRAARMYADSESATRLLPRLEIVVFDVNAIEGGRTPAVSIRADFRKYLEDGLSNEQSYATTWTRGIVAAHSNASHILSVVSQIMDEFIDEYLETNEAACDTASAQNEGRGARLGPTVEEYEAQKRAARRE